MNIPYTYEIVLVDENARSMEVVYSAVGHETMHVGVRIPYATETLQDVIASYAPVGLWVERKAAVQSVAVGTKGVVDSSATALTLDAAKQAQNALIAAARYAAEYAPVSVNGVRYHAGRDARAALHIAHANLTSGLTTEVNWKTASGGFVLLNAESIVPVISAMAAYVQTCFDLEKTLCERVSSASTVAAVQEVVWPA
jgi:hypothetical protein